MRADVSDNNTPSTHTHTHTHKHTHTHIHTHTYIHTHTHTHTHTHIHTRTHTHAERGRSPLHFPILDCPSSRAARSSGQPLWRPGTKSSDRSVLVRDGQESGLFFCMFFCWGS